MGFFHAAQPPRGAGMGFVEEAAEAVAHALVPAARFRSASDNVAWRQQDAQNLMLNAIRGDLSLQSGLARLVALASPQSATNNVAYNNNPKYQDIYKAALRDFYQRTGKTPSPDIAALIGYIAPAALPSAGLPLAPGSGVQVGAHPMTTQELLGTSSAISPALLIGGAALVALAMRKR